MPRPTLSSAACPSSNAPSGAIPKPRIATSPGARFDLPGYRDLWAVSVRFVERGAVVRQFEAVQLVKGVRGRVPGDDFLVVGGDLGTTDPSEAAFSALQAIVDVRSARGAAHDWLLSDGDLAPFAVARRR